MTSNQLIAWQKRMQFTNEQAAQALGISRATYSDYRRGIWRTTGKPVVLARAIVLACAALEAGLTVK